MSVINRLALTDDRSVASKPGGISVNPFRYAALFPFWPLAFGGALVGSIALTTTQPKLWFVALLVLGINFLFWLRVRLHFRLGCINPAKIVSLSPFTLAVMTDLATGAGSYPVLKILRHPVPRGLPQKVGAKCTTVATYIGRTDAEHWEDFTPVMIDCVTQKRGEMEQVLLSIEPEDWKELEQAIERIPKPLKLGIYPLGISKAPHLNGPG